MPPSAKQRMLSGQLYRASDAELDADNARGQALQERFNATTHADALAGERDAILRAWLGHVGPGVVVRPPLRCDYGLHVSIGAGTFVNVDCVMLDCAQITIGAHCQIASGVQLIAPTHPVDPGPRRDGWESAEPITIGDNVWLGAGAIVCPGVTIGDDTVVGAGAVVAKDLPAGVVAVGTPARVIREIGDADAIEVPRGR